MKKNGFTLVELLAVIMMLSLLVLIVLPSIFNSIENSSNDVDNVTKEMIYKAASLYVTNNEKEYSKNTDYTYCLPLTILINEGYLAEDLKLSNKNIKNKKEVKITYNRGYNYDLVDECVEEKAEQP